MTFSLTYIKDTLVPTMSTYFPSQDKVSLREYIQWLWITFFITCFKGVSDCKQWFSKEPPKGEGGTPFHCNNWMSGNWYEQIMQALQFTNLNQPEFQDKFFKIHQLHEAQNDYYTGKYSPNFFNTLDESMNIWLNKYCPWWMCVPCKPHPFSNEYHIITDGDFGAALIWHCELHEGMDHPPQLGTMKWDEKGATVGLMLRVMEPIHQIGKIVIHDSGFCMTAGILDQHNLGIYCQALIKK